MKKILLSFTLILLFIPTLLFVGCNNNDDAINMNRYFSNKVTYKIYNQAGTVNETLSNFTGENKDLKQYMFFIFTGTDWLYKMNIEKVGFKIKSNVDAEVEFKITLTNTKNGEYSQTSGTKEIVKVFSVSAKANKFIDCFIDINDSIDSVANTTTLTLETTDSTYFMQTFSDPLFNYSISNFQVYGKH